MKTAVVSGASYGLGKEISKQLLENDFKVYGISRSDPKLNSKDFVWVQADLSQLQKLSEIADKIGENKIDLLVNNAGIAFTTSAVDYKEEEFEKMFGMNFKLPILLTKSLFGKLQGGQVINISSTSDRYPDPGYGLYGSSKAALNLYFEIMAAENKDVKIINVLPSYIDTPLLHKILEGQEFDLNLAMSVEDVTKGILGLILDDEQVKSGARVMIIKSEKAEFDDGVYYPEDLWLYTTSDGKMRKT